MQSDGCAGNGRSVDSIFFLVTYRFLGSHERAPASLAVLTLHILDITRQIFSLKKKTFYSNKQKSKSSACVLSCRTLAEYFQIALFEICSGVNGVLTVVRTVYTRQLSGTIRWRLFRAYKFEKKCHRGPWSVYSGTVSQRGDMNRFHSEYHRGGSSLRVMT